MAEFIKKTRRSKELASSSLEHNSSTMAAVVKPIEERILDHAAYSLSCRPILRLSFLHLSLSLLHSFDNVDYHGTRQICWCRYVTYHCPKRTRGDHNQSPMTGTVLCDLSQET
jgi:hypothetical protein